MYREPQGVIFPSGAIPTAAEITHPFWEFQWELVYHQEVLLCSVILFFSGILCSAAGIGGGGIYVAVLMVSGRLSPHNAVPLSKAIVFFGAISSLLVNLYRQTRSWGNIAPKNVIDADTCRLVVPATLIGTFLGVLLNRYTSDYVIVMMLTALLGLMTGMVAQTAWNQAKEEQECMLDAAALSARAPALTPAGDDERGSLTNADMITTSVQLQAEANEDTPLLRQNLEAAIAPAVRSQVEKKSLSIRDGYMAGGLLFIVVVGGILRFHMHACRAEVLGDATNARACNHPVNMLFHSHMKQWMESDVGSVVLQQLVWSLPIWTCIVITVHYGYVANRDVGWKARSIMLYQAVAMLTGLLAGLVGVGGGLILSPFFLLTGMDPAIAVGTSATCVLFTSSSTTIQYIFTDRIIMSLALVYGMVTLIASFTGTCLVHWLQDRFSRKSFITSIVAVGVAISAVLSVVKFVYLVANPREGAAEKASF